ncbi:MAG: hypothetical protein DI551_12520 [Micavibrio aeruginosavorus]|uniref:Uncharacterized protein n=1 Tax=Micavibrio aeruginosavorus TaxID=349221 RepID=A0A2W5PFD4_9BACT|nr:MAG: hypothetical protein DI551_12520 [Micavibrio aeruginosavorus]
MTLFRSISKAFNAATAYAVEDFFGEMLLPMPQKGEFTKTWERGALVFINPAACSLRINDRAVKTPKNDPDVLQPIATRYAEDARIEINPGITCPARKQDILQTYRSLKERGLFFWDQKGQNCGYLPLAATQGIQTAPVVIDPEAVSKLGQSVKLGAYYLFIKRHAENRIINMISPAVPLPQADQSIYDPLRDAFRMAWDDGDQPHAIRERVVDFWQECQDMKERGLMVNGWLNNPRVVRQNYKNAYEGSLKYERRLCGA